MTNKLFSAMVYEMMGGIQIADIKCKAIKSRMKTKLCIFLIYQNQKFIWIQNGKRKKVESVQEADINVIPAEMTLEQVEKKKKEEIAAGVERRLNRIPFYPKEWKDSFGLPVKEHKKALETNLTEGYVEFSPTMQIYNRESAPF